MLPESPREYYQSACHWKTRQGAAVGGSWGWGEAPVTALMTSPRSNDRTASASCFSLKGIGPVANSGTL